MSSPATDLFKACWIDKGTRAPRTLAKIEISHPSPVTLYVATAETFLPDGTVWESGLKADRVRAQIGRLGTGPDLCDSAIHLANRVYSALPTAPICELVHAHQWQGAKVTLYWWNDVRHSVTGAQILGAVDLLQKFPGTVDSFTADDQWLHLNLIQDRSWNRPIALKRIDQVSHPNAPDGQLGLVEPALYGDFGAFGLRPPWASPLASKYLQEDCGGASGVIPLIVVDPGTGLTSARLLAAGHECMKLKDRAAGFSTFVGGGDVLSPIDPAGLTETLAAGGSFLDLASNAFQAYYGIRGIDVRTDPGRNTALNPRRAMDVFDETSFATLDQAAGASKLELVIPSQGGQGYIEAVEIVVAFIGNAGNTHSLRVYPVDHGASVSGTVVSNASTATVPTVFGGTWDAGFWSRPWRFAESAAHAGPIDFTVDFAGGTVNKASILWVAARVKHRPELSMVTPDVTISQRVDDRPPPGVGQKNNWKWSHVESRTIPGIRQVAGQFFGNLKGRPDDSSGTYAGEVLDLPYAVTTAGVNQASWAIAGGATLAKVARVAIGDVVLASPPGYAQWFPVGSVVTNIVNLGRDLVFDNVASGSSIGANAFVRIQTRGRLIERPPDILRHFLATYAGATQFELGETAFGSFLRARGLLRNGCPVDFRLAVRIGEATTTGDILSRICDQSLSAAIIDRFTGKWLFLPWVKGAPIDYDRVLTREDCADLFEAGVVSDVNLVQGVRVRYAYDHWRGRTLFESFVNPEGSSGGFSLATVRDQRLLIDATNDKLDWKTGVWGGGPFTYADTLTHATYTEPIELAADVQALLRTHITSVYVATGYGHDVKAGWNDALEFWYGANFYNETLPEGRYSAGQYAALVQSVMRAAAGVTTISVVYDQASNRLLFSTSNGTGIGFVSKHSVNCLSPATSAIWTLGFDIGGGSGASVSQLLATYPVCSERFWMRSESGATFQLLGGTGANKAASCLGQLGWDPVDDTLDNSHVARLPRGARESICDANSDLNGARPDSEMEADWIRDEQTAYQMRARAFDFGGIPPAWVRVRTHATPDLQRMRVLSFDASCDARRRYPGYGSDGSWAGKGMRVLQIEDDMGPSFHTEFYAEEA